MSKMILTAALAAAFIEIGAQTPPPAPPAPPALPATPAMPTPPAARAPRAPRPPEVGDPWLHRFDVDWARDEARRALELSRFDFDFKFDQEEVRRVAAEAREEARRAF